MRLPPPVPAPWPPISMPMTFGVPRGGGGGFCPVCPVCYPSGCHAEDLESLANFVEARRWVLAVAARTLSRSSTLGSLLPMRSWLLFDLRTNTSLYLALEVPCIGSGCHLALAVGSGCSCRCPASAATLANPRACRLCLGWRECWPAEPHSCTRHPTHAWSSARGSEHEVGPS